MTQGTPLSGQHLLIDADDTLWENNIYFEQAFDDFVNFLNHEHLSRAEILAIMDELAIANRSTHGYGARSFARTLRDTFGRISSLPDEHPDMITVERLGLRILDQEFEMLDGVVPTLEGLGPHHNLILLTKGQLEEQQAKVDRSQVAHLFDATIIVEEKTAETYHATVARLGLDPSRTWMIGNSPRSDINPALQAGVNAVFIPHPRTWHLEVEEVSVPADTNRKLLRLGRFDELPSVFATRDGAKRP
jgi:putative hydrolase of the HAD superfamily